MYNAVGIDVSKGKSTVAVLQPGGTIVRKPFDVEHSISGLKELKDYILSLDGDTKAVLECTGRYHEPILHTLSNAGIFVTAVNPHLIKNFGNNSIRKVKTDPADAKKIARYTLDNWADLQEYSCMDATRTQLKTLNAQLDFFTKQKASAKTNLISLLDMTYPGVNDLFSSPARSDGSEKWVDYADTFWHVDCVAKVSQNAFVERYRKWCRRHGYNFSAQKAIELHEDAKQKFALVPKSDTCKLLVKEAISQLNAVSRTVETYRSEMDRLASQLPEYDTVMGMYGVGPSMGPQLMAEIGDIRRFAHQKSLIGFAGTDPIKDDSGDKVSGSTPTSKRGSPYLRKTLFVIMTILLQLQPQDDPVYQFLDNKRAEGKKYHVYMTAGMTKFLRIYYGRVRDCLKEKGFWDQRPMDENNPV